MTVNRDNVLWERAKNTANSQNKSSDWVFIIDIYHYLGGSKKTLYVELAEKKYVVIGHYSKDKDLLYDYKKDSYELFNSSEVRVSKKSFVDADSNSVMIVLEKPDHSTYTGTSFSKSNEINIYLKGH